MPPPRQTSDILTVLDGGWIYIGLEVSSCMKERMVTVGASPINIIDNFLILPLFFSLRGQNRSIFTSRSLSSRSRRIIWLGVSGTESVTIIGLSLAPANIPTILLIRLSSCLNCTRYDMLLNQSLSHKRRVLSAHPLAPYSMLPNVCWVFDPSQIQDILWTIFNHSLSTSVQVLFLDAHLVLAPVLLLLLLQLHRYLPS